jgi:hypothetical protein
LDFLQDDAAGFLDVRISLFGGARPLLKVLPFRQQPVAMAGLRGHGAEFPRDGGIVAAQSNEIYPEDAPTVMGRHARGNEDLTIVDLGPEPAAEPTEIAPVSFDRPLSHDEIAHEAYAIFLERGGGHGRDHEDWLEAERRLRDRSRPR